MARKAAKKKSAKNKKDVVEYFEVGKKGEEKVVKAKGTESAEDKPEKKQIVEENKILINVIIIIGILTLAVLAFYFAVKSAAQFNYKGVDFEIVREIAPYRTSIPVIYQGNKIPYYFYLRNDPRDLENVNFDGELNLKKEIIINATGNLDCDGYGIIAVANLANLYKVLGANVIKDQNATCNYDGNYMFLQIQESDETSIEQFGASCYNINVKNCEILESTEKFMTETFIKLKEAGY